MFEFQFSFIYPAFPLFSRILLPSWKSFSFAAPTPYIHPAGPFLCFYIVTFSFLAAYFFIPGSRSDAAKCLLLAVHSQVLRIQTYIDGLALVPSQLPPPSSRCAAVRGTSPNYGLIATRQRRSWW